MFFLIACGASSSNGGGQGGAGGSQAGAAGAGDTGGGGTGAGGAGGDGGTGTGGGDGGTGTGGSAGAVGTGGSAGAGGSGGVDGALRAFAADYAAATCETLERCLGPVVEIVYGPGECETMLGGRVEATFAPIERAVAQGTVVFSAEEAATCLSQLSVVACAAIETIAACDEILNGRVTSGGSCHVDDECVSGLFCNASNQCPGVCAQRLDEGASCTANSECRADLDCDGTDTCSVASGVGGPCGGGVAPDCQLGLLCQGASSAQAQAGNCVEVASDLPVGSPCTISEFRCEPGLSCAIEAGTIAASCVAAVPSGAACTPAVPDMCPADEFCNTPSATAAGTCTPLPIAGEPCSQSGLRECAPGLVCVSNVCRALEPNGGACASDAGCYSTMCESGTCVAPECN